MGSTPILLSHSSNPCLSEFGVPVMEHRACPQEESVIRIRQLPGALLHEHSCGMRGDAGDLHTARGQFHYHGLVTYDVLVVMELATRRVQVAASLRRARPRGYDSA